MYHLYKSICGICKGTDNYRNNDIPVIISGKRDSSVRASADASDGFIMDIVLLTYAHYVPIKTCFEKFLLRLIG